MIVSTTLAGPGSEASIGDALRSCASLVDEHLILAPASHIEALAAAVKAAGIATERVSWRVYEWPDSYGEARNAALRFAEESWASWALTVDTDERLELPSLDLSSIGTGVHVLHVPDAVLAYQKPRVIRCGVGARWIGACSERLEVSGKRAIIPGQFHELPKTPEQELRRMRRGVEHMPAMIEQEPTHPQWRRHYAECLIGVGRYDEGIEQFRQLLDYPGLMPSAEAWAHYRIAESEIGQGQLDAAFSRCSLALGRAPGFIQEFGYLLAHISIKLRRYAEGVTWAEYALAAPLDMARGGHRSPTWRDGCERILASARDAQGNPARRPAKPAPFPFQGRAERFGGDYERVAAALVGTLQVSSHLDLGAGNGLLVRGMRALGVASRGIEASTDAEASTDGDTRRFIDFGVPLERWAKRELVGLPELVSCVEVAEHIPADRAGELVAAICARASRWIYFSAATPGQGGHGHVNEQPQIYWKALFADYGWSVDYNATDSFIEAMGKLQHCTWLKANAMLLKRF